jgi:hypothetical protein
MDSPHLDRLASVSRVLFDGHILEMQKQMRDLKHQLAVKTYGPRELNLALADANSTGLVPVCTCKGCLLEQRFDSADLNEIVPLKLIAFRGPKHLGGAKFLDSEQRCARSRTGSIWGR